MKRNGNKFLRDTLQEHLRTYTMKTLIFMYLNEYLVYAPLIYNFLITIHVKHLIPTTLPLINFLNKIH